MESETKDPFKSTSIYLSNSKIRLSSSVSGLGPRKDFKSVFRGYKIDKDLRSFLSWCYLMVKRKSMCITTKMF